MPGLSFISGMGTSISCLSAARGPCCWGWKLLGPTQPDCCWNSLFLLGLLGWESTGPDAPASSERELVSSAPDRFSLVGLVDFKMMEDELTRQPEKDRQRA